MNEKTLDLLQEKMTEYTIATVTALELMFERLGVPESKRPHHKELFAKDMGETMGRMAIQKIESEMLKTTAFKSTEDFVKQEIKKI